MEIVIRKNESARIIIPTVDPDNPHLLVSGKTPDLTAYTSTAGGLWSSYDLQNMPTEVTGGVWSLTLDSGEVVFDEMLIKVSHQEFDIAESVFKIRATGLNDREWKWLVHRVGLRNDEAAPVFTVGDGDIIDQISLQNDVSQADIRVQTGLSLVDAKLHFLGAVEMPDTTSPFVPGSLLDDLLEWDSDDSSWILSENALTHGGGTGGGDSEWTKADVEGMRWVLGLDDTKVKPTLWTTTMHAHVDDVTDMRTVYTNTRGAYLDNINATVATSAEIAALNDIDAATVEAECLDALESIHLDHLLAVDTGAAPLPGASGSVLHDLLEDGSGTWRFTTASLTNAPTGGSGTGDWSTTEQEEIRYALGLTGTKTAPVSKGLIHYAAVGGFRQKVDADGEQTIYDPADDVTPLYTRQFKILSGSNFVPGTTEPVEVTRAQ